MKVVDHEPHAWFLFEQDEELFLDANCNHSAAGYSILIRLTEDETVGYVREGRSYVDSLARAVQDGGPGSRLQIRDVGRQHEEETSRAIEEWRRRTGSAGP